MLLQSSHICKMSLGTVWNTNYNKWLSRFVLFYTILVAIEVILSNYPFMKHGFIHVYILELLQCPTYVTSIHQHQSNES